MASKPYIHKSQRSRSLRNAEDSKTGPKSQPPRCDSVCQNQISRRAVTVKRTKDGNGLEDQLFPAFIASQTFEQRKYGTSSAELLKNNLNPKEDDQFRREIQDANEKERNFMKYNKMLGDVKSSGGNISENSTHMGSISEHRLFKTVVASGGDCAVNKLLYHGTTDGVDGKRSHTNIKPNASHEKVAHRKNKINKKITLNPDDTYARVCPMDEVIKHAEIPNDCLISATKSSSDAESMSLGDMSPIEDEGWNPLFYEPVLVLCSEKGKKQLENGSPPQTLCQQLRNWLAQGQANYIKRQKALQLARQRAAENAEKLKQQKQQENNQPHRQPNEQHKKSTEQTFPKNKTQNFQYEQDLKKPIAWNIQNPTTRSFSSGLQCKSGYKAHPQSMQQTTLPTNMKYRHNFGTFNSPVPTLTPSAFPDPYLWSVDSSKPFWITDQRPDFSNVYNDDPYGLNVLPPTPKKKESTELVDAIKAGVGLLDPSPLEMFASNLHSTGFYPRTTGITFDQVQEQIPLQFYQPWNEMPLWNQNIDSFSNSYNNETFNNRYFSETYGPTLANNQMNYMTYGYEMPTVQNPIMINSDFEEFEQTVNFADKDDRHNWKPVQPLLTEKYWCNQCFDLEKKSRSYTGSKSTLLESASLDGSNVNFALLPSKKSLETISVEVLMNEATTVEFKPNAVGSPEKEQNISNSNDTDSDEFLSGVADDDADIGEDSFKSCFQFPCDWSEGCIDSRSFSSLEDNKHGTPSGASSSNLSLRFVTPSDLEMNFMNSVPLGTVDESDSIMNNKSVKESSHKETQTVQVSNKKMRKKCAISELEQKNRLYSIFDLETTRLKLKSFNIYMEPKELNAKELQHGLECTVEAMKELLKFRENSNSNVCSVSATSSPKVKSDGFCLKQLPHFNDPPNYHCANPYYPNGKPSIRAHGLMQNRSNDDVNSTKRNVPPRFNPHWKSSKLRVVRQQKQQKQRSQLQQFQQHFSQGLDEFPYQRTTVFTNSFRRNYTKRVWRKPVQIKSIVRRSPRLLPQKQQSNDSLTFEADLNLKTSSGPNVHPVFREKNLSSKNKHTAFVQ